MPTEPTAVRIRQLTARAGRAGYRLERASTVPYDWMLLDAEDGATTYSAARTSTRSSGGSTNEVRVGFFTGESALAMHICYVT